MPEGKMTDMKYEVDNSIIIVGDFNSHHDGQLGGHCWMRLTVKLVNSK